MQLAQLETIRLNNASIRGTDLNALPVELGEVNLTGIESGQAQ